MQRTHSAELILLSIIALTLFHAGPIRAVSASNLTLQKVIDFGSFTGKVTLCGFGAETPVNREKVSPGSLLQNPPIRRRKMDFSSLFRHCDR